MLLTRAVNIPEVSTPCFVHGLIGTETVHFVFIPVFLLLLPSFLAPP